MRPSTLLAIALATLALPLHAESEVALDGCEYRLRLPAEPTYKTGRPAHPESVASAPSQVAEVRDKIPAFRVECQALSRIPPGARMAMLNDLERQARSMGLRDIDITSERTRLGEIGRFTGTSNRGNLEFVVSGAFFLGERSLLSVIATEAALGYPAPSVQRVFATVQR